MPIQAQLNNCVEQTLQAFFQQLQEPQLGQSIPGDFRCCCLPQHPSCLDNNTFYVMGVNVAATPKTSSVVAVDSFKHSWKESGRSEHARRKTMIEEGCWLGRMRVKRWTVGRS